MRAERSRSAPDMGDRFNEWNGDGFSPTSRHSITFTPGWKQRLKSVEQGYRARRSLFILNLTMSPSSDQSWSIDPPS